MDHPMAPTAGKPESESGPPASVKTLAKGLRALDLLRARGQVGTVELSAALQVDKGAASRILRTLVSAGYAMQHPDRRYAAGPKLDDSRRGTARPGGASIRRRARPLLHQLHSLTGETVSLAIRADDQVLYLDKIVTELPLRVERPIGTLAPLHCTALGKVLLAFDEGPWPDELTSYTEHTAASIEALRAELQRIAAEGFARDDEEFSSGVRCVAAPLRDGRDGPVVGALGISGPTARIRAADLDALGNLVRRVALEFPD